MRKHLSRSAVGRFESLLKAIGPSGYEAPAARIWREMAREFADEVAADAAGNSLAFVNAASADAPTVLLSAHIDEIGLAVTHITDEGFIYVKEIGGWDPAVLVGQRITILGTRGAVPGVLTRRATHLMTHEEQEEAIYTKDLWVDIGAKSKGEVARLGVRIGDPIVIDAPPLHLPNRRLASRAIDNRTGAFVILEALRSYAASPGHARVVAAANTQEEFMGGSGGGALIAAKRVRPELAIVVDMTHANDHPDLDDQHLGDCALGAGPSIARGGVTSPRALELFEKAAKRLGIKYQLEAIGGQSGTDADAVALGGFDRAVATALVSIPARYMHTPNEIVSSDDIATTIELIAEVCRVVKPGMNWVPE